MGRDADYGERWQVRQRIKQAIIIGVLVVATAWSWSGVPGEQRGTVAAQGLGLMALTVVLAIGIGWLDEKLAERQSFDRRVVLAAVLLPMAIGVGGLLRALFLDDMFEETGGRTLILATVLGLAVSLTWRYRHNNGLAGSPSPRRRPRDADGV